MTDLAIRYEFFNPRRIRRFSAQRIKYQDTYYTLHTIRTSRLLVCYSLYGPFEAEFSGVLRVIRVRGLEEWSCPDLPTAIQLSVEAIDKQRNG